MQTWSFWLKKQMTWVGKQPEKSNRCRFLSVLLFITKWECKITDQPKKKNNKPSLNPDRLCYSSVLSPRAGMRKHSTQVKSSAKVKQFCMLALGQNKVPQTATEWTLACEAVLLDISWKTSRKYIKSISTKLKKIQRSRLLKKFSPWKIKPTPEEHQVPFMFVWTVTSQHGQSLLFSSICHAQQKLGRVCRNSSCQGSMKMRGKNRGESPSAWLFLKLK